MRKVDRETKKKLGEEIIDETQRAFEKAGFNRDKVAEEMALIAFSDLGEHIKIGENGCVYPIPLNKLDKKRTRAIKKIKEKRKILSDVDGEQVLEATFEFELHDKMEALKAGSQMAGLKPAEKHEHDLSDSLMAMVAAQLSGPTGNDGPKK